MLIFTISSNNNKIQQLIVHLVYFSYILSQSELLCSLFHQNFSLIQVPTELDATSTGEDAEKNITKEENSIEQSTILDAGNIEQNTEEDDKIANISRGQDVTYISKETAEQEKSEHSESSVNAAENSEVEYNNEHTDEDGSNRGLIAQPFDPDKRLNDEETKAEDPSGEVDGHLLCLVSFYLPTLLLIYILFSYPDSGHF